MATEKEKSQHGTFIPSLLSILENGPASVVTWSDGGTAFTVHDANRCVPAGVTTPYELRDSLLDWRHRGCAEILAIRWAYPIVPRRLVRWFFN
jgi:hypothetical protein